MEQGGLGLEVVEEGHQPLVEEGVEVEVGHFQSPEKTEYNIIKQYVQEGNMFLKILNQNPSEVVHQAGNDTGALWINQVLA